MADPKAKYWTGSLRDLPVGSIFIHNETKRPYRLISKEGGQAICEPVPEDEWDTTLFDQTGSRIN